MILETTIHGSEYIQFKIGNNADYDKELRVYINEHENKTDRFIDEDLKNVKKEFKKIFCDYFKKSLKNIVIPTYGNSVKISNFETNTIIEFFIQPISGKFDLLVFKYSFFDSRNIHNMIRQEQRITKSKSFSESVKILKQLWKTFIEI